MIRVTDLQKHFNTGTLNEVYALRGIQLHVLPGDFVTVIGTNGSGKSTLLNALAGTFLPDSGSIFIDGKDVTQRWDWERAGAVSRVFQNPFMGTAADMTLAENLHMASLRGKRKWPVPRLRGERRRSLREATATLEMQLEDRLDNIIGTLSGGQRQALTLLMAVITRPQVLLLDEHTAALDPKAAAQVIRLTRHFIERDNLTAVMVTHSMQQALELGNRTLMMHQGQIIEDLSQREKQRLTVEDLLERFAELRKAEKLTPEMLEQLRRDYR